MNKPRGIGYWLFMCGIFTMPFLAFRFYSITLSDYLLAISYLSSFVTLKGRKKIPFPTEIRAAIFFVIVGGLISSVTAENTIASLLTLGKFIFILYSIVWMLANYLERDVDLQILIISWVSGVLAFSIASIVERQGITGYYGSNSLIRTQGLSQHVTDSGGITSIAATLLILLLINAKKPYLIVPLLTIVILALAFSGSVTGYASLAMTILMIVIRPRFASTRKRIILLTLGILVITLVQKLNVYDILARIRNASSGRYDTLQSRLINIGSALDSTFQSIHAFFFGYGLDSKSGLVSDYTGAVFSAHNIFVQAFYQGGVLFLFGFLICWISFFKYSRSLERKINYKYTPTIITALIFGCANPLMYARYIWLPGLIVIALYMRNSTKANGIFI